MRLENSPSDTIKKLPTYHAIILATSEIGRVNLYRLVSKSHLEYLQSDGPESQRACYLKYREGLMIGSACEAGELYQAILRDEPESGDRPTGGISMIIWRSSQSATTCLCCGMKTGIHVTSEEDLRDLNRRIVKLGEQFKKPVVATCDVHFIESGG